MLWNWLHLSDLHLGMDGASWLWPRIEERFFDDLARLHDRVGPWDLVLFTGDLVQRGSQEEFDRLDEFLERLWRRIGSSTQLLAVPGNHDLQRPDLSRPGVDSLQRWAKEHHVPNEFWLNADTPERVLVTSIFENYQNWWGHCRYRPAALHQGMLAGDFSYSHHKSGGSLGIVGLNSTFLQIAPGPYEGQLGLHVSQFHACNKLGDGPRWAGQHDLCLLLTHQPPSWLSSEAQADLRGEIATSKQFAVHLFGHMHESRYVSISEGGSEPRRIWQALSLFGLEHFDRGHSAAARAHGYCAGRLEIRDDATAVLTFWPREARRMQDGTLQLVADSSCNLEQPGEHTTPVIVHRLSERPTSTESSQSPANTATSPGIKADIVEATIRDLKIERTNDPTSVNVHKARARDIVIKKLK
jgi:Calcineurin-like phosphoesterase